MNQGTREEKRREALTHMRVLVLDHVVEKVDHVGPLDQLRRQVVQLEDAHHARLAHVGARVGQGPGGVGV